ncbi:MAG: TA system VapC family ribonuclease toxin [Acidimicrobiia bacterium]
MTAQLCDVNVWLALALSGHAHHSAARQWFESIEGSDQVLICRFTQQSFLRLLTNAAVLAPYGNKPLTNTAAWAAYESLLADDRIDFRPGEPPGPGRRPWPCWCGWGRTRRRAQPGRRGPCDPAARSWAAPGQEGRVGR